MSNKKLDRFIRKYSDTEMLFDSVISFQIKDKQHSFEYGKTTMKSFIDLMLLSDYQVWKITNTMGYTFISHNLLFALQSILQYNKTVKGRRLQIIAHDSHVSAYQDLLESEIEFTKEFTKLSDLKIQLVNPYQ